MRRRADIIAEQIIDLVIVHGVTMEPFDHMHCFT